MAKKRDAEQEVMILAGLPPWDWPRNTAGKLKGFVQDRELGEEYRVQAADMAGSITVMDDDMAGLLLSILRDRGEPEALRAQSAISLGPALEMAYAEGYDDDLSDAPISEEVFEAAKKALRDAFEDESGGKLFRRRVLEAAVRAPEPWQREAIREAVQSPDPEWVLTAVFGMRYVRGGFESEIMRLIESPDPHIHLEAVSAAGSNEMKEAWPHVVKLLKWPGTEKELLFTAIEASSSINPEEAIEPLTELTDAEDADIAEAAEEALAMAQGFMEADDLDDDDFDGDDDDFVDEDTAPRA